MISGRPGRDILFAPPSGDSDHRLHLQRAQQERAALRESELEAQASPAKEPRERIEIWERLHALRLPRSHDHLLVEVIATQTRLTVLQVHEEQRRRTGGG